MTIDLQNDRERIRSILGENGPCFLRISRAAEELFVSDAVRSSPLSSEQEASLLKLGYAGWTDGRLLHLDFSDSVWQDIASLPRVSLPAFPENEAKWKYYELLRLYGLHGAPEGSGSVDEEDRRNLRLILKLPWMPREWAAETLGLLLKDGAERLRLHRPMPCGGYALLLRIYEQNGGIAHVSRQPARPGSEVPDPGIRK